MHAHAIYNSDGKVAAHLLRAELLGIADMVAPGSVTPVLERIEALAIELYHYRESVRRHAAERVSTDRVSEVSNA